MRVVKYKRGQIWWYKPGGDFEGHTYNQGKPRPIIIISNDMANTFSSYLLAIPCTSQDKKLMPTHISFDLQGTYTTALAESTMCVDVNKIGNYLGTVDNELLEQLENCLLIALGIKEIPKYNKAVQEPITLELSTNTSVDDMNDVESAPSPLIVTESTKKRGRQPKYSLEDKLRFINDYENHTKEYMLQKYELTSTKALTDKLYTFRKFVKENT